MKLQNTSCLSFCYLRKQKTKGGEVWSRERHWVFWKLERIWILSQFVILFLIFFFWSDWINQVYLRANHARLKAAHTYVTDELKTLGVPFLNRNAGFFVWIDFRKVGSLRKWGFSWGEGRHVVQLHLEERLILWQAFCFNKSVVWWGEGRTARCFSLFFSFRLSMNFPPCRNLTTLKPLPSPFLPLYHNCYTSEVKGVSLGLCRPHGNHKFMRISVI